MECSNAKDTKPEEEVKLEAVEEGDATKLTANQKKKLKAKQKKEAAALEAANPTAASSMPEEVKMESAAATEENSGDEENAIEGGDNTAEGAAKKKKKRKPKTKGTMSEGQDNASIRVLGAWPAGKYQQTDPPTIVMTKQYQKGLFPVGEIMEHPHHVNEHNTRRISGEEFRAKERILESQYDDLRRAAEVHRQVRKHAQSIIKPGMKIMDICNEIEATNRTLIEVNGLEAGIAFPTGASLNHIAAHWTPNIGDETVLQYGDVMKIDYGSHINGLMTDCAFTVAFDPTYDNLLMAVKDATNTGIKAAGIDVRLMDIGTQIQEVMESYEVEIKNKTYPVKCIENLCGHSMERYRIHAGKSVPIVNNGDTTRMEEGEQFAIETFGSTGKGHVYNDVDCSHYMMDFNAPTQPLVRNEKAKALFHCIRKNFGTLAFCRKWLEEHFPRHIGPLKQLVDAKLVNSYPPLADIPGCYTAQYEHTILLRPTCKEVITRGPDY